MIHTLFGQGTPILGLSSLFDENAKTRIFNRSDVWTVRVLRIHALTSATTTISQYQKLKLFQNIQSLL